MRKLGETTQKMEPDAWGRDALVSRTRYVIEKHDVGLRKPHYLGFGHRDWAVTHGDIDKIIEVLGHGAWSFTGEMYTGEPQQWVGKGEAAKQYHAARARDSALIKVDTEAMRIPAGVKIVTLKPTPLPKAPKVALITSTPGYWGRLWLAIKGEL